MNPLLFNPPDFEPLFAASPALLLVPVISSLLVGLAVYALSRTVTNTLHTDDLEQEDQWRYDISRINELRRVSPFYRVFQPLVQLLARFNRQAFRESLSEINREIQASGLSRFWTAEEYLSRIEIQAMLTFPFYSYFCLDFMGTPGMILAAVMSALTGVLLRKRLTFRARYRLLMIKRRMPFLLDLMTLLMEAGSTFLQALRQGVDEYRDHPAGVEFGRVLGEMSMGKTRTEAFESMRRRLSDDEITAIVGAIIQGENLGTPLARIFRTQADVLRVKRTQRAETMAGEAGVKMLLPAILVMAATVIIILGPFLLGFIYAEFL